MEKIGGQCRLPFAYRAYRHHYACRPDDDADGRCLRVRARDDRERTLAVLPRPGRIGGRRRKLDDTKRREIAEAVISGRNTAAQMARVFGVSPPTISRIFAARVAAGGH